MDKGDGTECLDDLRKKRLAYFETFNKAETSKEKHLSPFPSHGDLSLNVKFSNGNLDNGQGNFGGKQVHSGNLENNHTCAPVALAEAKESNSRTKESNSRTKESNSRTKESNSRTKEKIRSAAVNVEAKHELTKDEEGGEGVQNLKLKFEMMNHHKDNDTINLGSNYNSRGTNGVTAQPIEKHEFPTTSKSSIGNKTSDSRLDSVQTLKTTSFYFSNPDRPSTLIQNENKSSLSNVHKENGTNVSVKEQKSDGLDAYNETVERLIKATKEELLGIKPSDDIWGNLRSETTKNASKQTDKESVIPTTKSQIYDSNKADGDQSKFHDHEHRVLKDFRRSFSENDTQLDRNGNVVKECEQSNNRNRDQFSSFHNTFEAHPLYSYAEPFQRLHSEQKETQKSFNTSKVEEIFSSRQIRQSQMPMNALLQESQEFEAIKEVVDDVHISQDLSELGLSTHRPDTDRQDGLKVEADDINLGDTVSKELRNVLGEEKFYQFLMKSKRDIDDLHQSDSSKENSARKDKTPRLMKDKPIKPSKTFNPKSVEVKESQPKSILKNKEHATRNWKNGQRRFSDSNDTEAMLRHSQEFTPRQTDAAVVEGLIGEYLLKKQTTDSSSAYKAKLKTEGEDEAARYIPALNLEEVTKSESPRPKLNRPKHEPPSIYQDKPDKGKELKDKLIDRDFPTSSSKNYEQVIVPRNVAFSSSEIYNQAYGSQYQGQVPVSSVPYSDGSPPYGSPTSRNFNVLLTPTTSVAPAPMSTGYTTQEMYANQSGHWNYNEDINSFKNFSRQSSFPGDQQHVPHPPSLQIRQPPPPYSSVYTSVPDMRGFVTTVGHGMPVSVIPADQPVHIPHPPSTAPHILNQGFSHPSVSAHYVNPQGIQATHLYQHQVVGSQGFPVQHYAHNGIPVTGAQLYRPHPPTSIGAQVYKPSQVPTSVPVSSVSTGTGMDEIQPPPTPSTSNVEVQTDREDYTEEKPSNDDKGTVVEESTFTSVSQIKDEEHFVPHPPAAKKEGGPSPRRHHKMELASRKEQDSRRHIDGIRQHHEQRRQQNEDEKLSEEQIIERQKKFAKASLERYFSSLEDMYSPVRLASSQMQSDSALLEHDEEEFNQSGVDTIVRDKSDVVDDVLSTVVAEPQQSKFRPVVHGFVDFSENQFSNKVQKPKTVMHKSMEETDKVSSEIDGETLVNSVVNTDVTIQGGGLTERLHDLGIDVTHSKDEFKEKNKQNGKKTGGKKGEKKGKVLIVCPECQGLNKEYMSWCTQCGEMLIGVEPMLVSKNKEGKIRTKPLSKEDLSNHDEIRIKEHIDTTEKVSKQTITNPIEVNYVQDFITEKPFTLNLDDIKSEKEDLIFEGKKTSPVKSDGKDSGRPSSDDPDLDLQTQKIEEEVVNDICAAISDPVLKGYVRSHFSKSRLGLHESISLDPDVRSEKKKVKKEVDLFDKSDGNLVTKESVNSLLHDTVSIGIDTNVKHNNKSNKEDSKNRSDECNDASKPSQYSIKAQKKGSISGYPQKAHSKDNQTESGDEKLFDPPPLPNFSCSVPVSRSELSLKLPANSMEWSTDVSEVVSQNFEASHVVDEMGDHESEAAILERQKEKEERRKERRRKRGHGAIDVEVFGYEESRESRNSSRANRMVPLLNLAGNSSDEDDSVHSDFKPDKKPDVKPATTMLKTGFGYHMKASISAWEPSVIVEEPAEDAESLSWQQPIMEKGKFGNDSTSSLPWKQNALKEKLKNQENKQLPEVSREAVVGNINKSTSKVDQLPENVQSTSPRTERGTELDSPDIVEERPRQDLQMNRPSLLNNNKESEDWKLLFDPDAEYKEDEEEQNEIPEETEDIQDQPFISQHIGEIKPKKSKTRPKSAGAKSPTKSKIRQSVDESDKPVKSKVRQSIEEPGYQRKWARSSIAWSSYNKGELSTSSSLKSSAEFRRSRPKSAPKSRTTPLNFDLDASVDQDKQASSDQDLQTPDHQDLQDSCLPNNLKGGPSSAPKSLNTVVNLQAPVDFEAEVHTSPDVNASQSVGITFSKTEKPFTSNIHKSQPKRKNKKSGKFEDSFELDLDSILEHRLPKPSALDRLNDLMASPRSTYDKYLQMTPRINAGTVSRWQCLPDEILLHIFSYLDQTSLTKCAQVCHQYYRVAMDETLWKYITIKKSDLDNACLEEISKRHPISLALIQCNGEHVTAKGLRDLFRECADTLKELNIARCSRGALSGDSLLLHAAARCHNLTHIDASWCVLTDSGLMAISNSAHRLESLCISGCNAVTNDGLETVIRKHGTSLRVLEMFGCFNLSPRGLRAVANNCVSLITLNLGQCYKLTDSCISQLSTSLSRVETLDLRGCKQIKDNCLRRVVKNCTRLKNLSLANCPNITDVSILEIATYLTDIRSLDVCGCKNITDSSIRALVNTCTNLRHLDISSTSCTHRSVSMIANFSGQRLESLKINFLADVTEQSLIKLARHCLRLTTVHMYGCTSVRNLEKVREERPKFTIEM